MTKLAQRYHEAYRQGAFRALEDVGISKEAAFRFVNDGRIADEYNQRGYRAMQALSRLGRNMGNTYTKSNFNHLKDFLGQGKNYRMMYDDLVDTTSRGIGSAVDGLSSAYDDAVDFTANQFTNLFG